MTGRVPCPPPVNNRGLRMSSTEIQAKGVMSGSDHPWCEHVTLVTGTFTGMADALAMPCRLALSSADAALSTDRA